MPKKTERLLLFSIILVFISLRIFYIDQKNLWFDEIFSWHLTLGSVYELINRTSLDIHPPLYYLVLKLWNIFFGDSVFSMRLLSALFSAISIIFVYALSRRVLNQGLSMVVLLLFAINPLNVFYSQEVRMSAMNLLLNAGSVYFLLKLLDKDQGWKAYFKQGDVYFYILFRSLALYTHYFSFFILVVEVIIIILQPGAIRRVKLLLVSFAAIVLLYLPWIPIFIVHLSRGQSWRHGQNAPSVFHELLSFIKDLNLGLYYHYTNLDVVHYITMFLVTLYLCSLLLFTLSSLPDFRLGALLFPRKRESISSAFPFLLFAIPILLGIIISYGQKIEFYRYLSIIVPFTIIFVVYGISKLRSAHLVVPILILLMGINIYGLALHYKSDFKNDDYRRIIFHIENNHQPGDRIYVEPHYMGWSIDYYKKQWDLKLPNPVYIRYGWGEILDSLNVQAPERFWVIFDYSSVDTSNYGNYLKGLKNDFKIDEMTTYYLLPNRVELYRFKR